MTITCRDSDEFFDAITELVKRGLTFKSDYHELTITLTGGY